MGLSCEPPELLTELSTEEMEGYRENLDFELEILVDRLNQVATAETPDWPEAMVSRINGPSAGNVQVLRLSTPLTSEKYPGTVYFWYELPYSTGLLQLDVRDLKVTLDLELANPHPQILPRQSPLQNPMENSARIQPKSS